jgi:hypothetical protein
MPLSQTFRRWRLAAAGLAAALALTFFVGTPAGRVAASQFLSQFRGERLAVVVIDPQQAKQGYADLAKLGSVTAPKDTKPTEVTSLAEARSKVGFDVREPDPSTIPDGLDKSPAISVLPASQVRFTFDKAKADAYLKSEGAGVELPANLDGVTLVVNVPAAVLLHYGPASADSQHDPSGLVIGQAGLLTADVEGNASMDDARSFLIQHAGLTESTRRQLEAMDDWRNTLPIPVPAEQIRWKQTTLGGATGLVFADSSGLGGAAMWLKDGRVYGVAGQLDEGQLTRVANGLH